MDRRQRWLDSQGNQEKFGWLFKRIGKQKIVSGKPIVDCGKRVGRRKRTERGVKMEKKAALYARVSTERQEQAGTIESQVAELESYAQEQGYEVNDERIFLDQAVSGACLARPALDRLRDLAYEGGIDVLLCLSPDRLARQYVHQCLLLEEFQRWGIRVQFIQQPDLEDTPQNQLLLGVQGLFAEYERAVMRERMRRGRLHRLRQGERCFHQAPFGYRYIPVKDPNGGRWEIDTQEAAVVRQIFAWYTDEGWSLKKIATKLNETGVPVRRKGGRWNAGRISVILDQPAYAGKAYYNRYRTRSESVGRRKKQGRGRLVAPDKVLRPRKEWIAMDTPAILSKEVWHRAQDQRMHNKRFSQRNNHKQFYLLRGLLVCAVCDGLMIGKSRHKHPYTYYRCERGGKHRLPDVPQHTCTVNAEDAEKVVWEAVAELLQEPQRLAQAWADLNTTEPPNQREIKRLEHRSRQLERQWQRLLDAYQDGLLEKDELSHRKQALEREQNQLQSLLAQAQEVQQQNRNRLQTVQDFADFSQRMLGVLENPTEEVKREVIRLLVDHIVVEDDAIIIHHIVPITENERLSLKRITL
jgi:site-specific DNA recombinase